MDQTTPVMTARETGQLMCTWYALCDRPAVGKVNHVILGPVPVCQRCADKHALVVLPL